MLLNSKYNYLPILILISSIFAIFLSIAFLLPIDPDEREHIYASYLISLGQTPYLDFFEHHHPLLWYIHAPLFYIFPNTVKIWYAIRFIQSFLTFLTGFYVYKISFLINKNFSASVSAALIYFSFDIIRTSGLEFRPDTLMICLFIIGFYHFCCYHINTQRKDLYITLIIFLISFCAFQKALLLCGIPCLYIFICSFKNKTVRTDFISATLPCIIILLVIILYFYAKGMLKDYFELNWQLNILNNKNISNFYTPLKSYQIYTLFFGLCLSILCLLFSPSPLIKNTSLIYITYAFFVYSWKIRHFQYMLPFYPLFAILMGYTLSTLFKHKNLIINIIFLTLLIFWYKQTADEIKRLHYTRKNLTTNLMWEQKILDNTTQNDTIIYTKAGEHYFGGLRKQPLDYYWFNIGGLAYLDYQTFHRRPFPDLRKTIILYRPKIVFNGYWDNYLGLNQTLDNDYMQKHYIDKGIFYLRKD